MKKLDETIERFNHNAEYERTHGSLQGCMDFKQLAEWLKDYKRLLEQEPKTDYISIDDVMSVFDDFMCGEVDEEGTETFLEMLKDKAESEDVPDTRNIYRCSCGYGWDKSKVVRHHFCPNCGAKVAEGSKK